MELAAMTTPTLKADRILTVLKAIDRSATADDAIRHFMGLAKSCGFTRYLFSQLINPLRSEARHGMLFTDFPEDVVASRFQGHNLLHDPVVRYGLRSRRPFAWSQAQAHASRYGQAMMLDARTYAMNDGYMFPMRRPGRPDGGVSIAAETLDVSDEDLAHIELAAMHCYGRLEKFHDPQDAIFDEIRPLAPQELDVIQFAAAGKTFWEIGIILGISEAGAKDAMRRAREKLGAVNTVHAVSNAIAREIILP
jgi:LuxR family transcriptional regulator, quorum-sensing system regulator BjaR1